MGNVNMEAYQIHTADKDAPNVQKALDDLKLSESQTSEAVAVKADRIDIAPIFSTESAYSEGTMVYHSNRLYKFITDHAAGDWNAEEVEATNVDLAIQGAGGGASLPDYSTTEQATGQKWIDGSDIYVCVFDQESDITIGNSTYTDTNIAASGIAKIIEARAMQSNGTNKLINASCDSTYVKITSPFSTDTVRYITLFYTKSA